MAFVGPLNLSEAQVRGREVWTFRLNNWGDRGAGADPASLVFPSGGALALTSTPLFGLAIGPDSEIDSCILQPNNEKTILTPAGGITAPNPARGQIVVTRRQPWRGSIDGPFLIFPMGQHLWGDTYIPHPGVAEAPWAPLPPALDLYAWLKRPSSGIGGAPADVLFRRGFTDFSAIAIGTEAPILRPLMVHGRKRVRVTVLLSGTSTDFDIRVSGVVGNIDQDVPSGPLLNRLIELPDFDLTAGLDPSAGPHYTFEVDPLDCTWLLLNGTRQAAGLAGATFVVEAYDD